MNVINKFKERYISSRELLYNETIRQLEINKIHPLTAKSIIDDFLKGKINYKKFEKMIPLNEEQFEKFYKYYNEKYNEIIDNYVMNLVNRIHNIETDIEENNFKISPFKNYKKELNIIEGALSSIMSIRHNIDIKYYNHNDTLITKNLSLIIDELLSGKDSGIIKESLEIQERIDSREFQDSPESKLRESFLGKSINLEEYSQIKSLGTSIKALGNKIDIKENQWNIMETKKSFETIQSQTKAFLKNDIDNDDINKFKDGITTNIEILVVSKYAKEKYLIDNPNSNIITFRENLDKFSIKELSKNLKDELDYILNGNKDVSFSPSKEIELNTIRILYKDLIYSLDQELDLDQLEKDQSILYDFE